MYGFSGSTLYCSQLMPNRYNRYVSARYNIKNAVQNGSNAYALIQTDKDTYSYEITEMNMNNGSVVTYNFSNIKDVFKNSFSVSDGYAYFIRYNDAYTYVAVYSLNGEYTGKIKFDSNVKSLFNNNLSTYAMLSDGSIYRIYRENSAYVNTIGYADEIFDAGENWIATNSGKLVSLNSSLVKYTSSNLCKRVVVSGSEIYSANGSKLECRADNGIITYANADNVSCILKYKDNIIAVDSQFNYRYISTKEFKESYADTPKKAVEQNLAELPNKYNLVSDKYICGVKAGTKVAEFKNDFSSGITIYYNNEALTNSKIIRTGSIFELNGREYTIIVSGDLTGEGYIKSNDKALMIDSFIEAKQLSGVQQLAADYNSDGSIDNKDLVLMAQEAEK